MFLIKCPWCGNRDQTEFSCHGEAHIERPINPSEIDDESWAQYVFFRDNKKGLHYERWIHDHGCRRWFNVARNTITDEITLIYKMGERSPKG